MTATTPSTALVKAPDPEVDRLARIGQWLAASETGGNDQTSLAMAAALRLYYAAELGLPPMAASELSVIKGRLFVQAKLLRALANRAGYQIAKTDDSDTACTAVLFNMEGQEVGRYTFTLEDAKRAGLVREGSAWNTHPARMLWARASKYVLDDYVPHITLGLSTVDEPAEIEAVPATTYVPAPEPLVESDEERAGRLRKQIAWLIQNANVSLLPEGYSSWTEYGQALMVERFEVDRSDALTVDELEELYQLLEDQATPF